MPTARIFCQAGFVTYPNGVRGILVTGSNGEVSSEFLDLDTLLWEPKASLPFDVRMATPVPYRDSFLNVGGRSFVLGYLDTILYYDPMQDLWVVLDERMEFGRESFAAFMVEDQYAGCIWKLYDIETANY